ncbi:MAG: high-potential iron-sulfur protein [Rubrivivax sp.]
MMSTRRRFVTLMPVAGTVLLNARRAQAQAAALDPKDAQAVALGYAVDATKVDKAKYPKYAAGQTCAGCQLYGGAAGAASGPCPIYAGKQVAARGWCSAWVKKG